MSGELPDQFDGKDGSQLLVSARSWALTELAELDGEADATTQITESDRILRDMLLAAAHAVEDGASKAKASRLNNAYVGAAEDALGQRLMAPTKTQVKTEAEEIAEEVRVARNDQEDRPQLNEWIEANHVQTTTVRSTDAKQHTTYVWEFDESGHGPIRFETGTKDGERGHFHWNQFRDEIFDAGGRDLARPEKDLRDGEDWRRFIVEYVDHGPVKTTKGPRSAAVDSVRNHIRRQSAYRKLADANDRNSPHYNEEHGELWIPNSAIKRICEDNELSSVRALQVELDARGLTVDRINGVSETNMIDGAHTTWWVLDESVEDPIDVIDDADEASSSAGPEAPPDTDGDETDGDDTEDSGPASDPGALDEIDATGTGSGSGVSTFDGDEIEINGDSFDGDTSNGSENDSDTK